MPFNKAQPHCLKLKAFSHERASNESRFDVLWVCLEFLYADATATAPGPNGLGHHNLREFTQSFDTLGSFSDSSYAINHRFKTA